MKLVDKLYHHVGVAVSLFALTLGSAIYLLFRSEEIVLFDVLRALELGAIVKDLRIIAERNFEVTPGFFIFSLPGGCWSFAATNGFVISFGQKWFRGFASTMWVISVPLLGVLSEGAQLIRLFPGTFDLMDIISYFLGGGLGVVFGSFIVLRRNSSGAGAT